MTGFVDAGYGYLNRNAINNDVNVITGAKHCIVMLVAINCHVSLLSRSTVRKYETNYT